MKSRWSDADAAALVAELAPRGVSEALALRVYTSRLLGAEPTLVRHGGGNTSVKTTTRDLLGREVEVICVKGSGYDLDTMQPRGLPAMRLAPLLELRAVERLSDEAMVVAQRTALIDPTSPTPSVETLLHAWIPEVVVDHTHADAVLALTDQPDGEAICRDLWGERMTITPYVMPGFHLAHVAADAYQADPAAWGMILLKHGIFTWGPDARTAYERMIQMVDLAERRIGRAWASGSGVFAASNAVGAPSPKLADVAPVLRGTLAARRPGVLDFRTSDAILDYLAGQDLGRYANVGPVTPDHVIRTKPRPLILDPADLSPAAMNAAVEAYADAYRAYFERFNATAEPKKTALDPWPRVALVPGLGLFGVGATAGEAAVAADLAETTVSVVTDAEAVGRYESLLEGELFEMEYWSLEQAKLGAARAKPMAGRVVAITGGAGAIGAATAAAFAAEGAEVAVLDLDAADAERVAAPLRGLGLACDVTDPASVAAAFQAIVGHYGGLDVLVSNAGAAWSGRIGEVDDAALRASFELNFFAHQSVAKAAVAIFRAQENGGCLLFNVSKQALNPGPDFGPYGLPKAATLHLMRQYALDYGAEGIRSNAVNADRVRSGLLTDALIAERSAARGVGEAAYMAGNLLGREVTADDVAQAFVALAKAEKTTAAVLTVDGGNLAAAVR